MIDLEAARRYLRKLLRGKVQITDPAVLDAAAAVVVKRKEPQP